MTKTVVSAISQCLLSLSRNPEDVVWQTRLDSLVDLLPSGSGIDSGSKILDNSKPLDIRIQADFHHMDEHGFYSGWTEHVIRVTPSFDGIDVRVSGRDRNQIKDYLADTYHYALTRPVRLDVATTGDWKTATYVIDKQPEPV